MKYNFKCSKAIKYICLIIIINSCDAEDIPLIFNTDHQNLENLTSEELIDIGSTHFELEGIPSISLELGQNQYANVSELKKLFRSKLDLNHPKIINESRRLARKYPGEHTIDQICYIYDFLIHGDETKNGWSYVSDAHGIESYLYANQSLALGNEGGFSGVGDCDDFAILLSSLIENVGGTTRVILNFNESSHKFFHAYTQVYLGKIDSNDNQIEDVMLYVIQKYNVKNIYIYVNTISKDVWLNLDWQHNPDGAMYPGSPFLKADKSIPIYFSDSQKTQINVKSIERMYGNSQFDQGNFVQATNDGGNIVVGGTFSDESINSDILVINTNLKGYKKWDKIFGGLDGDVGLCIQNALDGGYIITGFKNASLTSLSDICLIKIDQNGNRIWETAFGPGEGRTVQTTIDGDYILMGVTPYNNSNDFITRLIKVSEDGKELWNRTFGQEGTYEGKYIEKTNDGGFIITGSTMKSGSWDIWLLKVDSDGNMIWDKIFGKSISEIGKCVKQNPDNGYIVIGDRSDKGSYDTFIIKIDSYGNMIWEKNLPKNTECNSIIETHDSNYIIVGKIYNIVNQDNLWVSKLNNNGTILWERNYGGGGN